MSCYVIGIGGTGAKCVEALIHLCAAGLLADDLYAVFVDPDKSNGSLERAQITLKQYARCKQLNLGSTDIFRTRLTVAKPDVWSPFGEDASPRLDNFFQYNHLKTTNKQVAYLFDILYSSSEKETPLNEGFRGRPSIGSAVMASTLQLGGENPWKTFRDRVAEDVKARAGAKIVLVGSIFGGTGASGIPTIARLIKDELIASKQSKAKLGGVLMLPYFSFDPVEGAKLRADAENFLLSTQAALKYYYQQAELDIYNAVYLVGDKALSPMKNPSIGGTTQRNEPHFMELYAALACLDFFTKDEVQGYPMIARRGEEEINWNDLPYEQGFDALKQKFEQLTRFAFAYLSSYLPMLNNISKRDRGYQAPWYINFFEREGIGLSDVMQREIQHLKEYCESFLLWLANVQEPASGPRVNLVDHLAFATKKVVEDEEIIELLPADGYRTDSFATLTSPSAKKDSNALSKLWERMSEAEVRDNTASGVGKFVHALYREGAEL
jgi:hypothetical protein